MGEAPAPRRRQRATREARAGPSARGSPTLPRGRRRLGTACRTGQRLLGTLRAAPGALGPVSHHPRVHEARVSPSCEGKQSESGGGEGTHLRCAKTATRESERRTSPFEKRMYSPLARRAPTFCSRPSNSAPRLTSAKRGEASHRRRISFALVGSGSGRGAGGDLGHEFEEILPGAVLHTSMTPSRDCDDPHDHRRVLRHAEQRR